MFEVGNTMVSTIRNMTYEFYFKPSNPNRRKVFKRIVDENPHLLNALDRSSSHPLIRNYSHIPTKNKLTFFVDICSNHPHTMEEYDQKKLKTALSFQLDSLQIPLSD